MSSADLLSGEHLMILPLCPPMVEGTNRLHQGSSVKTLITLRRAHLQVALLPHYCTEVVTQYTGIWGRDKTI